ncbi:MAG TPA: hypothetical protein VF607_06730 [Verrucomicrobiae bacterium]
MKKSLLSCVTVLAACTLALADSKDDIAAAAKKLGDAANYSWHTTVAVPEDAPFHPGPTDGKTEKDGYTDIKSSFRDNQIEIVKKGDKAAFLNQDGEWQTPEEAQADQGPGRFMAGMVRNAKTPADQAVDIAAGVKEFKADGEAVGGDLTEDAAKNLLSFRRRGGANGGGGPNISEAKGSAKFWIKDGQLAKYEFKVTGKVEFNGNEMNQDRTTTVEVKDVGATKVEVPAEAKKKLEPAPAPATAPATDTAAPAKDKK